MICAEDLLAETRDLATSMATEARCRTVVSRSYFSSFHHICSHSETEEVVAKVSDTLSKTITAGMYNPGQHNLLIQGLKRSGRKELIHLARTLHELLRRRADADYFLGERIGTRAADEALALAEKVFGALPA